MGHDQAMRPQRHPGLGRSPRRSEDLQPRPESRSAEFPGSPVTALHNAATPLSSGSGPASRIAPCSRRIRQVGPFRPIEPNQFLLRAVPHPEPEPINRSRSGPPVPPFLTRSRCRRRRPARRASSITCRPCRRSMLPVPPGVDFRRRSVRWAMGVLRLRGHAGLAARGMNSSANSSGERFVNPFRVPSESTFRPGQAPAQVDAEPRKSVC